MHWLRDPHLDLTLSRIETERCFIVPFTAGGVETEQVWKSFCEANKNHFVFPGNPETIEEEQRFIDEVCEKIKNRETFESFVFEKVSKKFLGGIGLSFLDSENSMNIGLWFDPEEQKKGYGTECYDATINWARKYSHLRYLRHHCPPENLGSKKLALKSGGVFQGIDPESGREMYHIPLTS